MPPHCARYRRRIFVDDTFGLPTVTDILRELEKPGRDPRPAFKAAVFMDGIETPRRLEARHGAGRRGDQCGGVRRFRGHRRATRTAWCTSRRCQKPSSRIRAEVVKPGDIVRVKVLEVDKARKRIALTLRLDDECGPARADRAGTAAPRNDGGRPAPRGPIARRGLRRAARSKAARLAAALRRAGLAEKRK